MKDFKTYASYLYNFIHIPVYLYSGTDFVDSYPENVSVYQPIKRYIDQLFSDDDTISYFAVHDEIYFGKVKLNDKIHTLVLGPVSQITPTLGALEALAKDYLILPDDRTEFFDYFASLPCLMLPSFLNLLLFIDCALNRKPSRKSKKILTPWDDQTLPVQISEDQHESFYDNTENELIYNNLKLEEQFTQIIENGDLQKLKEFARTSHQTSRYGTIAPDHIRQLKNTFLILDTLTSRAAIRGGLSPVFAYQMADTYMRQVEELRDENSIYQLMQTLQIDFCRRVAETKKFKIKDNAILSAIEYVHANLNKKIDVSTVAHAVGLSRSHLSRHFKQELGFSLNHFIRRCKLEEAKSLLLYTDKPISHISEYLCFSSQSYFQTLFKQQFGMTPLECRQKDRHDT